MKKTTLFLFSLCAPLAVFLHLSQPDKVQPLLNPLPVTRAKIDRASPLAVDPSTEENLGDLFSAGREASRSDTDSNGAYREDIFPAFAAWAAEYQAEGSAGKRASMEEAGLALAIERREAMLVLIKEDPEQALRHATPWVVRRNLPESIVAQLETRVGGVGDITVRATQRADDHKNSPCSLSYRVKIGDASFDGYVYGRRVHDVTRTAISLHGISIDKHLAIHESPVRVLEAGEPVPPGGRFGMAQCAVTGTPVPPEVLKEGKLEDDQPGVLVASGDEVFFLADEDDLSAFEAEVLEFETTAFLDPVPTTGQVRVLVVLATFPGAGPSSDRSGAEAVMSTVNQFLQDASYRRLSFHSVHVTEPLMMPQDGGSYVTAEDGPGTLFLDARAAADRAGYVLDYDYTIVAFPFVGFPWAGLGVVGGKGSWVQGNFYPKVVAHELGHNMGLPHARYWEPLGPLSEGYPLAAGRSSEYGNPFDVMGDGDISGGEFSGNFKHRIDWLPDANIHSIASGPSTGLFRLHRLDGGAPLASGRKQSMRIGLTGDERPELFRDGDLNAAYWIDFRKLPQNERAQQGVVVQWGGWTGMNNYLLNMDRGFATWPPSLESSPLVVGETFSDPAGDVLITPLATGGTAPHEFIDVIVTRGTLTTSIIEPVPDFYSGNASGEVLIPSPGYIELWASASASGSELAGLEFVLRDEVLGTEEVLGAAIQVEPGIYMLEIAVPNAASGVQRLHSVVRNLAGNSIYSEPVSLRFVEPEIQVVADPETVTAGGTALLTVSRVRGEGVLEAIEFFVAGSSVGVTDGTFEWTSEEAGFFNVYATAIDENGVLHRSPTIAVRVLATEGIQYSFEATPESVTLGEPLLLSVTAGEGQAVQAVEFIVDGEVVAERAEEPFSIEWEASLPGNYEVQVRVVEDELKAALSPILTVTVLEPTLILSASRTWVAEGEAASLTVTSGTLSWTPPSQVNLVVDGETVGSILESGPSQWTPPHTGHFSLWAEADLGSGYIVKSASIVVAVYSKPVTEWAALPAVGTLDHYGAAAGQDLVVVAGQAGGAWFLEDGVWTPATIDATADLKDVAYGADMFVAVGVGGTIYQSSDGKTWSFVQTDSDADLWGISYLDGAFWAVGANGEVAVSTDGVSWSVRDSGITATLRSITHGGGQFLVTGNGGAILTSTDGESWLQMNSGVSADLTSGAFGKDTFVVVGGYPLIGDYTDGVILHSHDGVDWELTSDGEWDRLEDVQFINGVFFAAGRIGALLSSFDGISWSSAQTGTINTFFSITEDGGLLFAVGKWGMMRIAVAPSVMATTYSDWVSIHLGSEEKGDLELTDPLAEPDGRISNLMRYAMGFLPGERIEMDDLPRLVSFESDGGLKSFGFTFRRSLYPTDVFIIAEASEDLQNWTPLAEESVSEVMDDETVQWITVVDDRPEPGERYFFRLTIGTFE